MNEALFDPKIQEFLRQQLTNTPANLALGKSPFPQVSSAELATQLDGLQRSRKKLPRWFETAGIYFPGLLSMEQSSSSLTASYKAQLIPLNCTLLDLTGGFGVDSYYFSTRAKTVVHCEQQSELSKIAEHNAQVLHAFNIHFVRADGMAYLQKYPERADVIYLDPSRRVKDQKVFKLSDCEPNVVAHTSLLRQKASCTWIKTAPLLDIQAALQELPPVQEVHIISVRNECKEVLFKLNKTVDSILTYHCAALTSEEQQVFTFTDQQEKESQPTYSEALSYLYEPDAALLKAGCFKYIAQAFGLHKLHPHTHLYTSEVFQPNFIGRCFQLMSAEPYAQFKKKKEKIQANVSTRNFPLKVEEIKKRHQIKDGGDDYLFFCTGPEDTLWVLTSRKVEDTKPR